MRSALWTVDSRCAITSDVRPSMSSSRGALDPLLDLRVHRAGGLVQHQDARIEGERAREGDQLPLAHRERGAALAQRLLVSACGSRSMKRSAPTRSARPATRASSMSLVAQPDVVAHVLAEQEDVLQHEADARAQLVQIELADGHAVEQDLAPLHS